MRHAMRSLQWRGDNPLFQITSVAGRLHSSAGGRLTNRQAMVGLSRLAPRALAHALCPVTLGWFLRVHASMRCWRVLPLQVSSHEGGVAGAFSPAQISTLAVSCCSRDKTHPPFCYRRDRVSNRQRRGPVDSVQLPALI